jgi:IMP dehydrogenase
VIADGGVGNMGHIVKARARGRRSDDRLAARRDGGGPGEYLYHEGKRVKASRGMGSLEAMEQGKTTQTFVRASGMPGSNKYPPASNKAQT